MPYTINISHLFPTATYAVEDVLTLKIGEQEYNTTLTYKIFVKTEKKPTYDVVIERSQFLVNGEEIDTKFLSISHKYMEAIFPLKCKVKDYVLFVTNISEIQERIKQVDNELLATYEGEGLEHIRSHFFKATDTPEKLREFIKQLHIVKALSFSIRKFAPDTDYPLLWNILPIGLSFWKGDIGKRTESNQIYYEPKIANAQEMMDKVITYIHNQEYYVEIEQENVQMYTNFVHQTDYTGKTGRIKYSETNVTIEVENIFLYDQKLTLTKK